MWYHPNNQRGTLYYCGGANQLSNCSPSSNSKEGVAHWQATHMAANENYHMETGALNQATYLSRKKNQQLSISVPAW